MERPLDFELPISHKPTFLNMDVNLENFHFKDFVANNSLSTDFLRNIFCNSVDLNAISNLNLMDANDKLWVWASPTHKATISSTVHDHINSFYDSMDTWKGWIIFGS